MPYAGVQKNDRHHKTITVTIKPDTRFAIVRTILIILRLPCGEMQI